MLHIPCALRGNKRLPACITILDGDVPKVTSPHHLRKLTFNWPKRSKLEAQVKTFGKYEAPNPNRLQSATLRTTVPGRDLFLRAKSLRRAFAMHVAGRESDPVSGIYVWRDRLPRDRLPTGLWTRVQLKPRHHNCVCLKIGEPPTSLALFWFPFTPIQIGTPETRHAQWIPKQEPARSALKHIKGCKSFRFLFVFFASCRGNFRKPKGQPVELGWNWDPRDPKKAKNKKGELILGKQQGQFSQSMFPLISERGFHGKLAAA